VRLGWCEQPIYASHHPEGWSRPDCIVEAGFQKRQSGSRPGLFRPGLGSDTKSFLLHHIGQSQFPNQSRFRGVRK
jgi:hypothetical protein